MLPGLNLPASLLCLLNELRPCFTAPGFATFCGLVAGLSGRVRRRTVVGMLLGGGLQHAWPHDRAHYFFARARWELDQVGLAVAQLAVTPLATICSGRLVMLNSPKTGPIPQRLPSDLRNRL